MTEKKKEITERLEREFDVCDKHILRINEALEGLGAKYSHVCGLLFQPDNRTSPLHRPIHISLFQIAGFHGSKNIPIYIGISG